ncbi:hypothetical protein PLICRDRAFT_254696 [Plicaturopsis crispa FD-325 SS-3]|nr:hypothetical protein PLICRDRAFT_254696 [Plicaturopsis crispa FD-325 SS-3]
MLAIANTTHTTNKTVNTNIDESYTARPRRIMSSIKRSFSYSSSSPSARSKATRASSSSSTYMYSTPEERSAPAPFSSSSSSAPTIAQIAMGLHTSRTPHLPHHHAPSHPSNGYSRRPSNSHPQHHPYAHPTRTRRAQKLPPPPPRSALKKPSSRSSPSAVPDARGRTSPSQSTSPSTPPSSLSHSSLSAPYASSSTLTPPSSTMTTTPARAERLRSASVSSLKLRLSKLLPSFGSPKLMTEASSPSSLGSPTTTAAISTASLSTGSGAETPRKAVRFSLELE